MKIVFYNLATAKEPWCDKACEIYQKKISHFMKIEIQNLKPKKSARDDADYKRGEESKLLLEHMQSDDFIVLFDEKGKNFDSVEFSKKIENALGSSKKRLVFIIGGAYGVNDNVKKRADVKVSLSAMTMNHIMAQVVSLEQIYRAFTIIKNIPYHNS
jgi:23S rRNA (pseudouridine1915-N3)-methyltransferase